MTQSAIATAADYADAMLTARKAKNILWFITFCLLVGELALFFVARYKIDLSVDTKHTDCLKYVIGGIDFLGVITPAILSIVLLLIVSIMLVGRLIGVSRLVSAFLWCVLLALLLFPWQAFLANQTFTSPEFKIPGVLYNWAELLARARLHPVSIQQKILFWSRFVGWPFVALVILTVIQSQSQRGLRQALGEIPPEPGRK
jgi:hypothetical protein